MIRRFGLLWTMIVVLALVALPAVHAQDGGDEEVVNFEALSRVDQALAHVSGYLDLETTITLARIDTDDENIPYTTWNWTPVVYTTASLGCPAAGQTYTDREVAAYRVRLTVRGYGTYDYRVARDGSVVILCFSGRPHTSSIGLDLTTSGTVGNPPRGTVAAAGLVGGPGRVDQAMRHVSGYLGLDYTITLNGVIENDPFIPFTNWGWTPVWMTDATAEACPQVIEAYDPVLNYGFEITLTVNDRDYTYYSDLEGTLLVLCINGAPHSSSIGIGEE